MACSRAGFRPAEQRAAPTSRKRKCCLDPPLETINYRPPNARDLAKVLFAHSARAALFVQAARQTAKIGSFRPGLASLTSGLDLQHPVMNMNGSQEAHMSHHDYYPLSLSLSLSLSPAGKLASQLARSLARSPTSQPASQPAPLKSAIFDATSHLRSCRARLPNRPSIV